MILHRLAHPRPRNRHSENLLMPPSLQIEERLFYVPGRYKLHLKGHRDVYDTEANPNARSYPAVVTFHGGGFTLGGPEDDALWAATVVSNTHTVVCSVHYRRAPSHPFPTAAEDGVDAVFYLVDRADELGTDPHRIAVSGFSAGGNVAFTVPLRLEEESSASERSARAGSRAICPQQRALPSIDKWPFSTRRSSSRLRSRRRRRWRRRRARRARRATTAGPLSPFARLPQLRLHVDAGGRDGRRTCVPIRCSPDSSPTSSTCRTSPRQAVSNWRTFTPRRDLRLAMCCVLTCPRMGRANGRGGAIQGAVGSRGPG